MITDSSSMPVSFECSSVRRNSCVAKAREPRRAQSLFEQTIQQEGQRFEQDDGMLQFDGFFKYRWRFHGHQCTRAAPRAELLQAQALLSETLAERNFRQRGQGAQVADAPAAEGFEQAIGGFFFFIFQCDRGTNFHGQRAQMFRFFASRELGDACAGGGARATQPCATQSAGGEQGRVGIGSYGDIGVESERGSAVGMARRDFQFSDPNRDSMPARSRRAVSQAAVFYAGRERLGAVEQGGVRGRFAQGRARAKMSSAHSSACALVMSGRDAQAGGFFVDGNNFFQRRLAFENGEGARLQFRFGAQGSRHGKIRHVDAGEWHGDIESFSH